GRFVDTTALTAGISKYGDLTSIPRVSKILAARCAYVWFAQISRWAVCTIRSRSCGEFSTVRNTWVAVFSSLTTGTWSLLKNSGMALDSPETTGVPEATISNTRRAAIEGLSVTEFTLRNTL